MKNEFINSDKVVIYGYIGLIGCILTVISDFFLIGRPSSSYVFFKLGTESMADIAGWRITAGTIAGVIALPFQALGMVTVYYGLKFSGKILSTIFAVTGAHTLLMGVAFHMSYAFIGDAWRFHYEDKITKDVLDRFVSFWWILIIIMLIELIFISIIFAITVLKGKTLYPRWMAVLNPFCVILFLLPLVIIIPAPVGGYIAPACLNLSTMVFVGLSIIVIRKAVQTNKNMD